MTTSQPRRTRTASSPDILTHLPIDRRATAPLHRQIYDRLRAAILGGHLRPGQRVPSTRALAAELGVSRLPVLTAYEQLLHEGFLDGRVGSGTFVSATLGAPRRPAAASPRGTTAAGAPRPLRTRDDGGLRPFRVSLPALDAFPRATWARLVARHAHGMSPAFMAYGDPAGVRALREAVAAHLRAARAVRCEADQVVIVSGSQLALQACAASLVGYGERVAIEDPGYPGARAALGAVGARLVPIPVDDDGIDVDALRRAGRGIRAVYVTPSHQYPLGVSMSATRRLALLDWAERAGAWVLEDDYDSEFRYVSRPLGALQGLASSERVVYIGTFSKVMFPALRVGYLVVPASLRERVTRAREALDLFSPTLYQLALADFLREGHFARHVRRMRSVYALRREALLEGLAQHCRPALTVLNADAGLHVTSLLGTRVDDVEVIRRLAERGATASPLSECYAGPRPRRGLLLGFGGATPARLREATRTLGAVLRA